MQKICNLAQRARTLACMTLATPGLTREICVFLTSQPSGALMLQLAVAVSLVVVGTHANATSTGGLNRPMHRAVNLALTRVPRQGWTRVSADRTIGTSVSLIPMTTLNNQSINKPAFKPSSNQQLNNIQPVFNNNLKASKPSLLCQPYRAKGVDAVFFLTLQQQLGHVGVILVSALQDG